jgi:hypothetical protein
MDVQVKGQVQSEECGERAAASGGERTTTARGLIEEEDEQAIDMEDVRVTGT